MLYQMIGGSLDGQLKEARGGDRLTIPVRDDRMYDLHAKTITWEFLTEWKTETYHRRSGAYVVDSMVLEYDARTRLSAI